MNLMLVIDGGTTNLRVTAVDAADHRVLARASADGGVRVTAVEGHNGHLKQSLKRCIDEVLAESRASVTEITQCVAYGMITSNMGLKEIPHLIAPAGIRELHSGMRQALFPEILPVPFTFIPGVKNIADGADPGAVSRMDMMRGEETEAVGLFDLLRPGKTAVFVLPGSHNKFVRMDGQGRILGCMTSVSGELLDAVSHHTVLADSVGRGFCSAETYSREWVVRGAEECARSGLGRAAFAGRILNVLSGLKTEEIQSWLLGAVLTEDVRALKAFADPKGVDTVYVAGKAPLQEAFCDVMKANGIEALPVDTMQSGQMGLHGALLIYG